MGDTINLELPITGTDHDNEQIDTIYKGDFLVTQLKHDFDQSERQHRILMSVVKDSIPEEFKNIQSSEEQEVREVIPTYQHTNKEAKHIYIKHNPTWRFK